MWCMSYFVLFGKEIIISYIFKSYYFQTCTIINGDSLPLLFTILINQIQNVVQENRDGWEPTDVDSNSNGWRIRLVEVVVTQMMPA